MMEVLTFVLLVSSLWKVSSQLACLFNSAFAIFVTIAQLATPTRRVDYCCFRETSIGNRKSTTISCSTASIEDFFQFWVLLGGFNLGVISIDKRMKMMRLLIKENSSITKGEQVACRLREMSNQQLIH
ncbi:hypothetical protein L6452_17006 [Arctium lappa]|uniref:Uncharacterized protein n=1 Tax=Arctium lappa TaxID=4217 RepID=A0ACB9C234_ARCLA|nr:hypothetical protein L6452_17006 [Arctium lappa]